MSTFTKHLFVALAGVSLLAACNRPYATYQRTAPAQFRTAVSAPTPVTPVPTEAREDVISTPVVAAAEPVAQPTVVTPAASIQTVRQQLNEALASRKVDVADKKVQKRMARVDELLAKAEQKSTLGASAPARKLTGMERIMLKKMDKKLQKHLAPDKTQALDKLSVGGIVLIIIGLIVAVILNGTVGLLLLLIGVLLLVLGLLQ